MQKSFTESYAEENKAPWWRKLTVEWPKAFLGWAADLRRLLWGFIELNLRKTFFRHGRGRVRCPCQHPSDSGRAFETSCDAMVSWSSAVRFRRLCPLLKQAPDGEWRCSVDTADVRPFWGRAFAYFGGTALAMYLVATVLGFFFLRIVGYPVTYPSIAWPPAWHDIEHARARFFLDKATRALKDNKPLAAMMALSQSYQLDPTNYAVGRMLAQFSQPGWGGISNRVYAQLMRDHPEKRGETSAAWFLALLASGDFSTIETLAAGRVATDPAWLNALLVASRRTGDTKLLQKLLQPPNALPPYARQICALELQLRAADPAGTRRLLEQPMPASPAPYLVYYWIDRQIHAGLADDALLDLKTYGALLDPRDRIALLLETYSAEGWQTILRGEVDHLLETGTSPALVELVCAHLIRHPDPYILEKLFAAVYQRPLPANSDRLGAYTSLFCAAGVSGDWVRLQASAAELKSITGTQFTALETAEAYFRGGAQTPVSIDRCLRSLPGLPVDVSYALYERSAQSSPQH